MKVNIKFTLNEKYFDIIEQAIFKLVLNGCTKVALINKYLYIFDKNILAQAISNLVNKQILIVNIIEKTILPSSPIQALYDLTKDSLFNLKKTRKTSDLLEAYDGKIDIKSIKHFLPKNKYHLHSLNQNISKYILDYLIPEIDLTYYVNFITFTILDAEHGEKHE
jgi:hypothetical protein